MWAYILKRLLLMVPTLLGVLLLTFTVIQFVPGGPVEQVLSQLNARTTGGEKAGPASDYRGRQGVDPAQVEELKKLYGFDKPAHERFMDMVVSYATFDLGRSFVHHKDVWTLIKEKLPVSISLGLWTFFLSYLVSVPLGIAKAVRAGSRFDVTTSLLVLAGYAIPGFVLGVALLVLFGGGSFLQWFPLRGLTSANWEELSLWGKVVDYLWHITLPVTASVLGSFAVVTMLTKNAFLDEIRKQYVLTAAFIGAFFAGSLLIETLFTLDGLGLLGYESVMRRDYPVVMGTLYLFTLIGLFTKLISDLCYVWVDPRVKLDG